MVTKPKTSSPGMGLQQFAKLYIIWSLFSPKIISSLSFLLVGLGSNILSSVTILMAGMMLARLRVFNFLRKRGSSFQKEYGIKKILFKNTLQKIWHNQKNKFIFAPVLKEY